MRDRVFPLAVVAALAASALAQPAPKPSCPGCAVVPVVLVASDYDTKGEGAARTGAAYFLTAVKFAQRWYLAKAGKTFALGTPSVLASDLTADQWIALSCLTATPDERKRFPPCDAKKYASKSPQARYAYYSEVEKEFKAKVPNAGADDRRYIIAVFAGSQPDVWLGAADGAAYAAATPRSTSVFCPSYQRDPTGRDARCRDSVYAIAHELGHSFGLQHSCDQNLYDKKGCENSFMQTKHPPDMGMLAGEREALRKNKFFRLSSADLK